MSENNGNSAGRKHTFLGRVCIVIDSWRRPRGLGSDPFSLVGPVNLSGLNSSDSDLSPFVSADGLSLYFATTRPGGLGGEDLWVARRSSTTNDFGAPVN